MNAPAWLLCGIGVLFCLAGILLFYKSVFEENRKTAPSILVMIMGVILIAIATAKFFNLV